VLDAVTAIWYSSFSVPAPVTAFPKRTETAPPPGAINGISKAPVPLLRAFGSKPAALVNKVWRAFVLVVAALFPADVIPPVQTAKPELTEPVAPVQFVKLI